MHPETVKYPRWHSIVAGAVAGFGSRLITAPLDLLKIRRQLMSCDSSTNVGILSSLQNIMKAEGGFRSLFKGNLSATYLWIGYAAVQFSMYSRTSDFLTKFAVPSPTHHGTNHLPSMDMLGNHTTFIHFPKVFEIIGSNPTAVAFFSGATAGVTATVATYPWDICRTAFASKGAMTSLGSSSSTALTIGSISRTAGVRPPPATILQFFTTLYKVNGIRGLFSGVSPAVVQIIPYMGINFALYDYFCRLGDRTHVGNAVVAGAFAGGVSKMLVYPMDTVKKRLQAQTFAELIGLTGTLKKDKSILDCAVRMAQEEGLKSFYRGLVPTVVKSMVATSVTFATFTMTKNTLEMLHDRLHADQQ